MWSHNFTQVQPQTMLIFLDFMLLTADSRTIPTISCLFAMKQSQVGVPAHMFFPLVILQSGFEGVLTTFHLSLNR